MSVVPTSLEAAASSGDPTRLRAAWREALAGLGPSPGPDGPDPGGCRARSDLVDALVRAIAADRLPAGAGLCALGGYGRRELAPRSDLDLLVLLPEGEGGRGPAGAIVQALWDVGLEVGHAVRTLAGVRQSFQKDLHAATATLEGRWLCGDPAARRGLQAAAREMLTADATRFSRAKLAETDERHASRGLAGQGVGKVLALAPDLKQGRGTLRDLQLLLLLCALEAPASGEDADHVLPALARGVEVARLPLELERDELAGLERARALLLATRSALHELGPPGDRLDPQLQVELARRFGHQDRGQRLAVEVFMDEVYHAARRVDRLLLRLRLRVSGSERSAALFRARPIAPGVSALGDHVQLDGDVPPAVLPRALAELFRQAQRTRRRIGPRTQEDVRRALSRCDKAALRADPEVAAALREVLGGTTGVAETVRSMHESGWLSALFPEWEALECLSQADPYHAWTVDEHTLTVFEGLEGRAQEGARREREELLREELLHRAARRDLLRLGVLLHDAGKVGGAVGHVERGAALVADVAARFGLAADEERHVRFLVAEHLTLSRMVDKKDVDAPSTLDELLRLVGRDPERLDHLYLLTAADVQGVSPSALTRWKDHLLTRLYERAREALERGGGPAPRPVTVEEYVALLAPRTSDPAALKEHLSRCGRTYLTDVEPEEVLVHLALLAALRDGCAVRCSLDEGAERVWILASDRPGLFSAVCGAISGAGYEILGASTFAREDGLVFDAFALHPAEGKELAPQARWAKLERTLRAVLSGSERPEALIAARLRRAPRDSDAPSLPPPPVRIRASSEVSATSTLVDVSAPDRVGLLFDLTRALTATGCDIRLARVATKGNRAVDVFHVTDRAGRPLSPEACRELEAALQRAARGEVAA